MIIFLDSSGQSAVFRFENFSKVVKSYQPQVIKVIIVPKPITDGRFQITGVRLSEVEALISQVIIVITVPKPKTDNS